MGTTKITRVKESLQHTGAKLLVTCGAENICAGRYETMVILIFLQSRLIKKIAVRFKRRNKKSKVAA